MGPSLLFKMVGMEHVRSPTRLDSLQLGVRVTVVGTGRLTGVQIIIIATIVILFLAQVRL